MNKTITIYDEGNSWLDTFPTNLAEHINWLNGKLLSIPEEFRQSAYLHISATESYGAGVLIYSIKYERPETKEEIEQRELAEKSRANLEIEWKKKLFEQLKKELNQ
jgi:hypothetical protein